jgi:hypothetical protein
MARGFTFISEFGFDIAHHLIHLFKTQECLEIVPKFADQCGSDSRGSTLSDDNPFVIQMFEQKPTLPQFLPVAHLRRKIQKRSNSRRSQVPNIVLYHYFDSIYY